MYDILIRLLGLLSSLSTLVLAVNLYVSTIANHRRKTALRSKCNFPQVTAKPHSENKPPHIWPHGTPYKPEVRQMIARSRGLVIFLSFSASTFYYVSHNTHLNWSSVQALPKSTVVSISPTIEPSNVDVTNREINQISSAAVPGVNDIQLSFCAANNFLPQHVPWGPSRRPPGRATDIVQSVKNTRRFSIRKQDYQPTHSKACGTSDELLNAVAMGKRRWDDDVETANLTLRQKEDYPSSFIPHQCYIPYYQPDQICDVLNRFSHVIVQGDSLIGSSASNDGTDWRLQG